MSILVPVKQVIHPSVRVQVRSHAGVDEVEYEQLKRVMNPFDEIALEEAVRLKEAGHASAVLAVSCGTSACEDVLRTALAVGADRALRIDTDADLQPLAVARLLAALCRQERPKLVLCGKQAIDNDANQTGQMLAALLGWPQATFASKVVVAAGSARVTREIDEGQEIVEVDFPAVITTDLRLNEPRYATLPNMLKARDKAIACVTPAQLGEHDLAPRLEVMALRRGGVARARKRVASVGELVGRLREEEVMR